MYLPEYLRDRGFFIEGSVKNDVPCLLIEQAELVLTQLLLFFFADVDMRWLF